LANVVIPRSCLGFCLTDVVTPEVVSPPLHLTQSSQHLQRGIISSRPYFYPRKAIKNYISLNVYLKAPLGVFGVRSCFESLMFVSHPIQWSFLYVHVYFIFSPTSLHLFPIKLPFVCSDTSTAKISFSHNKAEKQPQPPMNGWCVWGADLGKVPTWQCLHSDGASRLKTRQRTSPNTGNT